MTLKELIAEKNNRLDEIPDEFVSTVKKVQRRGYNSVLSLINSLDIENGSFEMTESNLLKIQQIENELSAVLRSREYMNALDIFSKEFNIQKQKNDSYFKKAFPDIFKETTLSNQIVRNSQKAAIQALAGSTAEQKLIEPVKKQIEYAISTGASLKETSNQIDVLINGSEDRDGVYSKYSKQVSWDSFAISDRSYTNIISEDLDVEWFLYSGGEVRETRCFCEERNGNYYHYKEIEAWGRGEDLGECNIGDGRWAGQAIGTNEKTIFILAGGYNCKHSMMPVSITLVPIDVVQRNISNGNFIPNEVEQDLISEK